MNSTTPGRPVFRKPPPEGVVEVVGIGREWSIAPLEDGALLAARKRHCRISHDGGISWGEERELPEPVRAWGLLRLQSGALAAFSRGHAVALRRRGTELGRRKADRLCSAVPTTTP